LPFTAVAALNLIPAETNEVVSSAYATGNTLSQYADLTKERFDSPVLSQGVQEGNDFWRRDCPGFTPHMKLSESTGFGEIPAHEKVDHAGQ
jgi:hypothetical protein